jgi:hypothetical protein
VELVLQAWFAWQTLKLSAKERWSETAGEGVISTAIAVLIMALIGLAMWTLFNSVFNDAGSRIENNVNQIG